jgi:general stress protein 26
MMGQSGALSIAPPALRPPRTGTGARASGLPDLTGTEGGMAERLTEQEAEAKVWRMIQDIRTGMMTTQDEALLRARPMHGHAEPEQRTIWFFTRAESAKTDEIEREHAVCVAYADPAHQRYVSISGRAAVVRDRAKIEALWNPFVAAWFPDGKDDPHLALIKVAPEQAEYWDSPASKMVQLWRLAKAKAERRPPELGRNEKVELWPVPPRRSGRLQGPVRPSRQSVAPI